MEIVKIRLQMAALNDGGSAKPIGAGAVVRELGFRGLYKGATACFIRDIPFSAIVPTLCNLACPTFRDKTVASPNDLFIWWLAGTPTASLVTPGCN